MNRQKTVTRIYKCVACKRKTKQTLLEGPFAIFGGGYEIRQKWSCDNHPLPFKAVTK